MTLEQKTKWIQYLQSLHKDWGIAFNKKISLGQCSDKLLKENYIIGSLIGVLYRVETFEDPADNVNCLTDEDICKIKNKIVSLTQNCNC